MENINIEQLMKVIMEQAENSRIQAQQTESHAIAVYEQFKNVQEISRNIQVLEVRIDDKFNNIKNKFDKIEGKIDKLEELENHVFLTPPELNEVASLIDKKARNFADYLNDIGYYPNAKNFGSIVGRVKTSIRAMIKIRFKCQRSYMVKHTEYGELYTYLNDMTVRNFLDYRNKRKVNKDKIFKLVK